MLSYQAIIPIDIAYRQQSPLRATTHTTKVRTTSVFLRCTSCVEQSATVTSRTIWHCVIQTKLKNFTVSASFLSL